MKYLLLLLVAMIALSSCGDTVQTHTYKVKFLKSGNVYVMTSDEPKASMSGIYEVGDTVLADPIMNKLGDTKYASKAIIIIKY